MLHSILFDAQFNLADIEHLLPYAYVYVLPFKPSSLSLSPSPLVQMGQSRKSFVFFFPASMRVSQRDLGIPFLMQKEAESVDSPLGTAGGRCALYAGTGWN